MLRLCLPRYRLVIFAKLFVKRASNKCAFLSSFSKRFFGGIKSYQRVTGQKVAFCEESEFRQISESPIVAAPRRHISVPVSLTTSKFNTDSDFLEDYSPEFTDAGRVNIRRDSVLDASFCSRHNLLGGPHEAQTPSHASRRNRRARSDRLRDKLRRVARWRTRL
jgi:hypothetical protein